MGRNILQATRKRGDGTGKHRDRPGFGNGSQKNKGARWSKGHSCVSNPKTTKHREQVSSTFLHPVNAGKSLLTIKNLNNNAAPSIAEESDDDTILSSDVASLTITDNHLSVLTSASSIRTIASGWSQISHNAFERFLRKFKGDIVSHKDMLSILGAASEVIGDAGGKKNETEFFATFMSLLSSCPPDQYQPVMSLVCIIIGKVSAGVLKLRFGDIYQKISTILSYAQENDDDQLIRTTIEAFTKLLKVQDSLNFEEDKVLESGFYMIMKCGLHDKPRVRRKVRQCLKSLIIAFNDKKSSSAIPKLLIGWIYDQLACYPMCNSKVVADSLTLLVSCWGSIPKISFAGAKKLFEAILRVMSGGDASIMKIGLSFFVVVFQNQVIVQGTMEQTDPQNSLTEKLLRAIWDLQPDWRNIDTFVIWLTSILLGVVRTRENNGETKHPYLPSIFEIISPIWLTNYGKRILKVLQDYLPHVIHSEIEPTVIDPCFQTLAKSFLIIPPNPFVLQATECLLEQLSQENFTTSAKEVFLQLTPLIQGPGVTQVLGKFIKAFGVEKLWQVTDPDIRWNVILPLLSDNLNDASILFWKKEMLTQIGRLGSPKSIWLAFIGFTKNPKDPENFPAELVGKVISDKPELRLYALTALRQFIAWAQCREISEKYSKNFLPLLFNLYALEKSAKDNPNPGHADAIGVTIQKYIPLCNETLVNQLLEKAFTKLDEPENDPSAIHDLIAFLSLEVKDATLQEKVLKFISDHFQNLEQRKRIYRIMTFLAKNKSISDQNLKEIYKHLCESKGEKKSNAAAIRLECINVVTDKNPSWMKTFLPEVILNLISANAKAKRFSTQYVINYCTIMKEENKTVNELEEFSITALRSSSTLLVSSTTYFLFLAFKELNPSSPHFDILNCIFENLRKIEDPLVWKYSLAFINLNLSLYKGQMGTFATTIGQIAGNSKYPRREINKILARMIKVFGATGLKAVLPNAEDPKMRVRIKNIAKKLRKMKEEKAKGTSNKEEDSDHEDKEDEFGQVISDNSPMVIKEGLVDFLSPREITQALIKEVKPFSEEKVEFKESKDGKLLIGNMEDDSDDDISDLDDTDMNIDVNRSSRKRKSPASIPSSKKSTRTSKTTFSISSKKRKTGAAGSRSVILPKKKKFSSKSSVKSSMVRFK